MVALALSFTPLNLPYLTGETFKDVGSFASASYKLLSPCFIGGDGGGNYRPEKVINE